MFVPITEDTSYLKQLESKPLTAKQFDYKEKTGEYVKADSIKMFFEMLINKSFFKDENLEESVASKFTEILLNSYSKSKLFESSPLPFDIHLMTKEERFDFIDSKTTKIVESVKDEIKFKLDKEVKEYKQGTLILENSLFFNTFKLLKEEAIKNYNSEDISTLMEEDTAYFKKAVNTQVLFSIMNRAGVPLKEMTEDFKASLAEFIKIV